MTNDRPTPPLSHLLSLLLLLGLLPLAFAHWFSPLVLGAMTMGIMVLVAVWETFALRRPLVAELGVKG